MWHREVVTAEVEATVQALVRVEALAGFYLAGGTGLALQLGHRRSADLDFFRTDLFDEEDLIQRSRKAGDFTLAARAPHTLHILMGGVKVSFLAYDYPLLLPLQAYLGMQVADPRDIACMKLTAVANRGTKRDFVDLYSASRQFGLAQLLSCFERKYAGSRYNPVHLQKSLVYFQDAEKDPMPNMLIPLSWEEVKHFFLAEAPRLV